MNHYSHQVFHLFENQALANDPSNDVFNFFDNFCKINTVKISGAVSLIHKDLYPMQTKFWVALFFTRQLWESYPCIKH